MQEYHRTQCSAFDGLSLKLPLSAQERASIHTVILNEVVPPEVENDFYYSQFATHFIAIQSLFESAGVKLSCPSDLTDLGVYVTNVIKNPKKKSSVLTEEIQESLPDLHSEINLFPKLKFIFLAGDVARKAINLLGKKSTGRRILPSSPTYKIRSDVIYWNNIRLIPGYIITGKNPQIERSKREMNIEGFRIFLSDLKHHKLTTQTL